MRNVYAFVILKTSKLRFQNNGGDLSKTMLLLAMKNIVLVHDVV